MSGVFLLVVATAIFSNDIASIQTISMLAFFGAMLGDHTGFYVGHWLGPWFHDSSLAQRYGGRITKSELLIRKYGSAAIFIGRFIPAIRSLIPAVLGISRFGRLRYTLLDTLACLLWSAALAALVLGLDLGFSFSDQAAPEYFQ